MKRLLVFLAAFFLAAGAALPQGADDQYLRIYTLIQEGDGLAERDQASDALAKDIEARTALQHFQRGFPEWSADVVKFRLNYLGAKITALSAKVPQPAPAAEAQEARPSPG